MAIGKGWCLVVGVRLLIGFFVHYGYIHPDEYFQSTEIAAGDIFDLKVYRPWEFNTTQPIRSIIPVYLMSGFPLLLLKLFAYFTQIQVGGAMIIKAVRIWMMFITFTVDWNVYLTLKSILKKDVGYSLSSFMNVLTSSVVILAFGVKTFSNTLEMIMFAWLIRVTISDETSFKQNIPTLALILVTGIFTRPTFLAYAFIPVSYNLLKSSRFEIKTILLNILECLFIGMCLFCMYAMIDSVYFNSLNLHSFFELIQGVDSTRILELIKNNITVSPLNFVLYNVNSDNLAQHGLHNRFTHIIINAPSLFLGLIILAYFDALSRILRSKIRLTGHLSREKSIVLLTSCMFSIIVLSAFPHQEPRFLLPLIIPLVILYAPVLAKHKLLFIMFWFIPNMAMTQFWGCMHQAGVVPAILSARNRLVEPHLRDGERVTALFWKSYMPPRSLFGIPVHGNHTKEPSTFTILDLAGKSEEDLFLSLKKIFKLKNESGCSQNTKMKYVYLFVPGSVIRGLSCVARGFKFQPVIMIRPHFSGEHPPLFNKYSLNCTTGQSRAKICPPDDWLCNNVPQITYDFLDSISYKVFSVMLDC